MRDLTEIRDLLAAKTECIWVQTIEEQDFLDDFLTMLVDNPKYQNVNIKEWTNTSGVTPVDLITGPVYSKTIIELREVPALFEKGIIPDCFDEENTNTQNIWILKDLDPMFQNPKTARYIRDVKEGRKSVSYSPIIVISPNQVNGDVAHLFKVVEYSLPSSVDIFNYITNVPMRTLEKYKQRAPEDKKDLIENPTLDELEKIAKACSGLTIKDVAQLCKESIVKFKTIKADYLAQSKIDIVKKSGLLDYKIPEVKMSDIGGCNILKNWLYEQEIAMSPAAQKAGLDMPKGALFLGIPGTSKTMSAEAFAGELGIPLIKLSMDKIMDKMVGQSEQKIARAIEVVKKCAPCVFLLDELEKSLGGATSQQTDGGVGARVMKALLEFMNDNENGIYVIMTSNDISVMPPEFTRSGRIDAQWYFALPTTTEREAIFDVHLTKRKVTLDDTLKQYAVRHTEKYTGAEIQQVVKNLKRINYIRTMEQEDKSIVLEDIERAIREVIPIAESSKEKIAILDQYCEGRARKVSEDEVKEAKRRSSVLDLDL